MADKLTLADLASLANETSAIATINANNALIETAIDNTLSRDGTSPNEMEAPLDMNSNRILNLPEPISANEPVRLQDMAGTIEVINGLTPFGIELMTTDDAADAAETLGLGITDAPLFDSLSLSGAGGTFLSVIDSTSTAGITVRPPTSQFGIISFQTGSTDRWIMGKNATAESGTNAGSNFFINRYDDAGVFVDAPLTITRSTGAVTVLQGLTASSTLAVTGLTTLTGKAVLGAGSTSVAPLTFTSGTNLTTAAAGSKEYDGTTFYNTAVASTRGVDVTEHFISLTANQTGTDVNTAQPWFPGGGGTGMTVAAGTTYFFEGVLSASKTAGTTSRTIGMNFGGTATITSISYWAHLTQSDTATWSANGSGAGTYQEVATNVTLNFTASTSANQVFVIRVSGIVRINAGGTFIPNFQYSAAPGGAPTIRANSWFKLRPVGSGSVLNVGNWS